MDDPIIQNSGSVGEFGQELLPARPDTLQFVSVYLSNNSPQIRKDAHCFNCGRIICQYYSETRVIIIGEMREMKRPIDVFCSRCKWMYRIGY